MSAVKKAALFLMVILTAVILFTGTAYAAADKTGIVTGDVVNLRAKPNTSATILNQLNKGASVSIAASEGDWYKVVYNDCTGWIHGDYVLVRDVSISSGIVSGSVVNVRSKPDLSAEVLTQLNKGAKIDIYECSGDWYRTTIGENRYAWIYKDCVSVRSETVSRGLTADDQTSLTVEDTAESDINADKRQQIVEYAKTLLGIRYVYGGSTTKGFDCSGFVSYVFKHFGITLERASRDMGNGGTAVKRAALQPGDLVFFDTNGGLNGINHVGIYIGNDKFIHASSYLGRKVTISCLSDSYYSKNYMRARDYLAK